VYRRRYFGVLEEEDFEGDDGSEEEAARATELVARSEGEEPARATGLVARSEGEDAARATGKVPQANLSEVLHAGYKAAMGGKEPSIQLKAGVVAEAGISFFQMVKAESWQRGLAKAGMGRPLTAKAVEEERYREQIERLRSGEKQSKQGSNPEKTLEEEVRAAGYETPPQGHKKMVAVSIPRVRENKFGEGMGEDATHRADRTVQTKKMKVGATKRKLSEAFEVRLEDVEDIYGTQEELEAQEELEQMAERRKKEEDLLRKEKRARQIGYDSEGEVWDNEKQRTFKRLQEKDDVDKMKRRLEEERSTSKERKEDDKEDGSREVTEGWGQEVSKNQREEIWQTEREGDGEGVGEGGEEGGRPRVRAVEEVWGRVAGTFETEWGVARLKPVMTRADVPE
jgi:hypothetical protein